MSSAKKTYARVTTKTLQEMKASGEKISMLTAYDYTLGGIVDKAGVDVILVGDSASNVMAGHETTGSSSSLSGAIARTGSPRAAATSSASRVH